MCATASARCCYPDKACTALLSRRPLTLPALRGYAVAVASIIGRLTSFIRSSCTAALCTTCGPSQVDSFLVPSYPTIEPHFSISMNVSYLDGDLIYPTFGPFYFELVFAAAFIPYLTNDIFIPSGIAWCGRGTEDIHSFPTDTAAKPVLLSDTWTAPAIHCLMIVSLIPVT